MNAQRFDSLAQLLGHATLRRRVLVGLALGPVAGLDAAQLLDDVAAKKKHKKKRKPKKPQLNDYGCLDVGQPCEGNSSICCSGICEGAKPKKGKKDSSRCAAHDTAEFCFPDNDTCTIGANVPCNADSTCLCVLTTGNAGFCGDFTFSGPDAICRDCSQDTDCQEEFGPGAACVVMKGVCSAACAATGRTACIAPCPTSEK